MSLSTGELKQENLVPDSMSLNTTGDGLEGQYRGESNDSRISFELSADSAEDGAQLPLGSEPTGLDDQFPSQGSSPAEGEDADGVNRPSNTILLCTAFTSFMTFASVQLFFAFYADSQAMKGDSAAMVVDSMTYLFNWYAEKQKTRFDEDHGANSNARVGHISRERRKLVLRLEIIPPLVSVTTLVVVTIIVLKQAIEVLYLDTKRSKSEQADPKIHLMMTFSVVNLGLDFLNVFCFARAKHLLGFETAVHSHSPRAPVTSTFDETDKDLGTSYLNVQQESPSGEMRRDGDESGEDEDLDNRSTGSVVDKTNLNMVRRL